MPTDKYKSAYMTYGGDEVTGGGLIGVDCGMRNVIICVVLILLLYCTLMEKSIEGYANKSWYPVKGASWSPVQGASWRSASEAMMDGNEPYAMPYLMTPASQYTSPYTGPDGYGQWYGPYGPTNV